MATIQEYIAFSNLVYRDDGGVGSPEFPGGWEYLRSSSDEVIGSMTGYFAIAYRNLATREIVIAYRGTEFASNDWAQNINTALGKAPDQYQDALLFYNRVKALPGVTGFSISHTGHSLGGGLANLMAATNLQETAVGFNSIGVGGVLAPLGLDPSRQYTNILNISSHFDPARLLGERIGDQRGIAVSSLPLVPDFIEPLLAAAAVAKLGPIGTFLLGIYFKSQHSIENMVETVRGLPGDLFSVPQPEAPLTLSLDGVVSGTWAQELQAFENALDSSPALRDAFSNEAYFSHVPVSTAEMRAEQVINDTLGRNYIGDDAANLVAGADGADRLTGGSGADIIFGDEGADVITSGLGADFLIGGAGFDTYYADEGDTILDSDGKGVVLFNGDALSGGRRQFGDANYTDGTHTYSWSGNTLVIDGVITVQGFDNSHLSITLEDDGTESDDNFMGTANADVFNGLGGATPGSDPRNSLI